MHQEIEELVRNSQQRGVSVDELVGEKISPIKDRLSKSSGKLLVALARRYTPRSHGATSVLYSLNETLYVGLKTEDTRFPIKGDNYDVFLLNVKNPCYLTIRGLGEGEFTKGENSFLSWGGDRWSLLYYMDKPVNVPEDSVEHGCFRSRSTVFPSQKPRLELYFGDSEAAPFLQENLDGWRYLFLSSLLGYELPINNIVKNKIEGEQLKIFDEIRQVEAQLLSTMQAKEDKVKTIKATGGVIHHGVYIELTDEFTENSRFNHQIREERERIRRLAGIAVKRKYHENGVKVERRLDAGVVMNIDLREFFSQRKSMLDL